MTLVLLFVLFSIFSCQNFTTTIGDLGVARWSIASTSVGTMALFAGGSGLNTCFNVIDIFDSKNEFWTNKTISTGRCNMSAVTVGDFALFAGGADFAILAGPAFTATNDVLVFDSTSNVWSNVQLSEARHSVAATAMGTKAYFAAGSDSARLDIYDVVTRAWETRTLSTLGLHCAVTVAPYVLLVSLRNGVIDFYNGTSDSWDRRSIESFAVTEADMACLAVGQYALFAGGTTKDGPSDLMVVYNPAQDTWNNVTMPFARSALSATALGSLAFFSGGLSSFNPQIFSDTIQIYNVPENTWRVARLSVARSLLSATTLAPYVFVGVGGQDLDFTTGLNRPYARFDLFSCPDCTTSAPTMQLIPAGTPIPLKTQTPTGSTPGRPGNAPTETNAPVTSSLPPTATIVPPPAQCAGPWIPIAVPGSISAFCSACVNGTMFLIRTVDYSLPNCQNVSSRISQSCSFPCPPSNASEINITQSLLDTGYLTDLFKTLQIPVGQIQITEQQQVAHLLLRPCDGSVNMTYVQLLIGNLMDEIYAGRSLPLPRLTGNCSLSLGKTPDSPPPYGLFSLVALLVVVILIVIVGMMIWKYYYGSTLHQLPKEISWSYLDKLSHPWRWTNRIEYFVRDYQKGSSEWKKVQSLLSDDLVLLTISAVYNPMLTVSFINQWKMYTTRLNESSEVFFNKTYAGEHKMWVMEQYETLCSQFAWNNVSKYQIPLVPAYHGTDFYIAEKIAQTGFAVLSTVDAGFYGKGIYFTTKLLYTMAYAYTNQNPAVIVSYINLGHVYPVTEDHKGPQTLLGGPLKQGYNSHFVMTNKMGNNYDRRADVGSPLCNEIVVGQESQILPAFIITFDEQQCKAQFEEWSRDTPTAQDAVTYKSPKDAVPSLKDAVFQELDSVTESHCHVNMESEEASEKYFLI